MKLSPEQWGVVLGCMHLCVSLAAIHLLFAKVLPADNPALGFAVGLTAAVAAMTSLDCFLTVARWIRDPHA